MKRTSRNGSPASQLAGSAKTSNDGISFFKFPSDPVMRQQWTQEVQRTRDRWSGPSQLSVLCFTAYCFEPDSAIAATMGITKQQRLKPDVVPTLFERQAPQRLGARGSTGDGSCVSRKRLAATTAPETTWNSFYTEEILKLNALTLGFKCSSSNKTQVFFSWLVQ